MIQILESTIRLATLSDMLAEIKTLRLTRDLPSYPKCGVFTEKKAPVVFAALKAFGELFGQALKYVQINQATVGDGISWHNDLQDGTSTALILYLTRDDFDEDTGGYLELGMAPEDITPSEPRNDLDVAIVERVFPRMGLGVLFDNTNPKLVHRVIPMVTPLERFTILALFS